MHSTILNTKQAAVYLGVSAAFLERDRCTTARIPFVKLGTRSVRYRLQDLEGFVEQQLYRSTSDKAGVG